MDDRDVRDEADLTRRRYTGRSRGDAEAGFKLEWPSMAGRYTLLAETWDDDLHTLTVLLKRLPADSPSTPHHAESGGDRTRPG